MNDGLFIWLTICTILVIAFVVIELFSDDESD